MHIFILHTVIFQLLIQVRIMVSVMVIIDDMHIHCNLLASPNSTQQMSYLQKKISVFLERASIKQISCQQFFQGRNKIFSGTEFFAKISFPQNKFTCPKFHAVTGQTLFLCRDVIAS